MARIKFIEEDQAEGKVAELYEGIKSKLGMVLNVMKVLSPAPDLFEPWLNYMVTLMFTPSDLPQDMKEKIACVVSNTNLCSYCVRHHVNFQKMYGVNDQTAQAVARDFRNADIPDSEKTLLEYAEKCTIDATKTTDADVDKLRENGYSDRQILEATLVVGQFSLLNRLVDGLGVEFDPNIA